MAPLCRFWPQGACRNGADCRFEHPASNSNASPFGGFKTNLNNNNANRFSPLDNASGPGNRSQDVTNAYKVTKEGIKVDLADERPTWILSCYGPGRDAPEQLFGGYPREQSLEEVMMHIRGASNQQQAMNEVTALYQQARGQIETTVQNLDGAVQFVLAAENKHPNRIDICKQNTMNNGTSTGMFTRDQPSGFTSTNPLASNSAANQNPFSSTTQANPFTQASQPSSTTAFGQPSTLGQQSSPFGGSGGVATTTSAFGQPSPMGAARPAFGQTPRLGASGPAFGQASTLGQKPSPFSAASSGPSPFGQAASSGPSPFGQTASSSGQNAFGQPSSLGQRPSPFGATSSAPSNSSPFAQAAASASPPSQNPFGQPTTTAAVNSNPFAQVVSTNAANDLAMDTSGPALATSSNPFGQAAAAKSPFGAPAATTNGFGGAALPQQPGAPTNNPFGQPARPQQASTQAQSQPAGAPGKTGPYGLDSTKQHPHVESYINKARSGQIMSFKGQPVMYKWKVSDRYQDDRPDDPGYRDPPIPGYRSQTDGAWTRLFFPDGPPGYNKDTEVRENYTAAAQALYAKMAATGRFEGDMPEVPPLREDCVWDF